jgi:glycosyltransferase involved in cell wall biosynthesis
MARVLALEPYYGGSHRAFLDGWLPRSRHEIELLTLPAYKWKWRMRGACLTFAEQVGDRIGDFDTVFASDFLDLAAFASLCGGRCADVRMVAYFHENQLTYPVPDEAERDYQYGFTNITSCLAADRVLFNSRYHLDDFLDAVARLLKRMPDAVPPDLPGRIRERAQVVPVGVEFAGLNAAPVTGPLTVLWNHRWEYDKAPDEFFEVMMELADDGLDFRLAVTGEAFRAAPPVFERARLQLAGKLVTFGDVPARTDYCRVLGGCDVVVSTAVHEFFGISVVEAVRAGCMPLLPDRLSYPEILPVALHEACLYADRHDLKRRLAALMADPAPARAFNAAESMIRFGWDVVAPSLDEAIVL